MPEFRALPHVKISTNELLVLERVIFTYKSYIDHNAYLFKIDVVNARNIKAKQTMLSDLHLRLKSLFVLYQTTRALFPQSEQKEQPSPDNANGDTYFPLTVDEMQAFIDAISFFTDSVTKMIPSSQERDGVLNDLEGFRLKIVAMLPGSK